MARKILLADDSVTAQNMGRKILADAGYEVLTVNNGSAALKKIGEQKPDLIVLDVYMPGYSGLEVCQRLKDVAETARVPVLLTVGKLEPFKPEEAKRVRADGFIVKPFEASELLSALSKLEDKVVPRPEPSKPGRLARAVASIEERTNAPSENAGWKSRLSIPSESKKKIEEANPDDPAIYNAVNKDLRTTVATPAEKAEAASEDHRKVDLGALALAGVPADVTPEEIAALAAAAAQVKSISHVADPPKEETPFEVKAEVPVPDASAPVAESVTPAPVPESSEASNAKESGSEFIATAAEVAAALDSALPADTATTAAVVAQVPEEAQKEVKKEEDSKDASSEPVTMAMAPAESQSVASGPRWTAVAVPLEPEDAALSLEQEMQHLYSAQNAATAAETAIPETAAAPVESSAAESANVATVSAETSATEAVTSETVTSTATEAMPAAETSEAVNSNAVSLQLETPAQPEAPAAENRPIVSATVAVASEATPVQESPAIEASASTESAGVTPAEQPAPAVLSETQTPGTVQSVQAEVEMSATTAAETIQPEPTTASESHAPESAKDGESELAASTAAAWASWRRIRATSQGESVTATESKTESELPQDAAVMAVAAGAEKSPEAAQIAGPDDSELANIVDGILADMRPRIMEEVSRKLRNKQS